MTTLLQKVWNIVWVMWEHRNGVLHRQQNQAAAHNMRDLDKEVKSLYERAELKLQRTIDKYLIRQPLRMILRLPRECNIEGLKQWLLP
jgi:hypothetical protein